MTTMLLLIRRLNLRWQSFVVLGIDKSADDGKMTMMISLSRHVVLWNGEGGGAVDIESTT